MGEGLREAKRNKDGRINFFVYWISEIYQWGYKVIDTIEDQTLKRGYNYPSRAEAREAGFKEAIKIIDELEGTTNEENTRSQD